MAQRFGRYWLHEKIGHGGMAEVFRATIGPDPQTYAFEIALKRLHPELQRDRAVVDMFMTEADVAKLLRHPNIVQLYEAGSIDGQSYIAMEYVWGTDLASLGETLRKKRLRLPPELTVHVGLQVLRALDYVHRAATASGEAMDIVHRDVTPSNVYVTLDGRVKLGDFGVARVKFLEERDDPTLKGKIAYMSPEVLAGGEVDQRLDLWSLGVTLWELLTSRRPYEGVDDAELLRGGRLPRIPPAHEVDPQIAPKLSAILETALHPRARRRPRTAVELYQALKVYQRGVGVPATAETLSRFVTGALGRNASAEARAAQPPATGIFERPGYRVPLGMSPTQRFELVRRRRVIWPAVAAAAIVGGAGGGLGAWQLLRTRQAAVTQAGTAAAEETPGSASGPAADGQHRTAAAVGTSVPGAGARSVGAGAGEAAGPSGASAAGTVPPGGSATAPIASSASPSSSARRERPAEDGVLFSDETGSQRSPARLDKLMQRGRREARHRRWAQAESAFRDALAVRPTHVPAMLGRADALLELDRDAEAERLVRSALEAAPQSGAAYLLLGDVMWVQGRDEDARRAYMRCVEVEPKSRSAQTARRILARL